MASALRVRLKGAALSADLAAGNHEEERDKESTVESVSRNSPDECVYRLRYHKLVRLDITYPIKRRRFGTSIVVG